MSAPAVWSKWQTILGSIAILVFSLSAAAVEPFFRTCDVALESRGYEHLKAFYGRNKNEALPDSCFRLNRNEFLVTVTDTGRVGQGLYYYDASTDSYGLVDNRYRPNIEIKREFIGSGQKRYVLMESSNLHNGNWNYGYEVLFLTSSKRRQSFVLNELLWAQEDPESGFCGSRLSEAATRITGFHIAGEGEANVRVEFSVEEEDCKTLTRRKYIRAFQVRASGFTEIK